MPTRRNNALDAHLNAYFQIASAGVNRNGTVLDVNGITFTQDGIEAAAFNTEPVVRLDDNAEITAEDLQRLIDQVAETPHTYAVPAQEIQLGVGLARHRDGLDARAYMFDNDWVTYNPYIYAIVTEDEEPELDEKNEKLDDFLGEFIKVAV